MDSKEGKLLFSKDKLLGKRFLRKHIVQVNLELHTAPSRSQDRKSKLMEPYVTIAYANQMVNTILESETLPRTTEKGIKEQVQGSSKGCHLVEISLLLQRKDIHQIIRRKARAKSQGKG